MGSERNAGQARRSLMPREQRRAQILDAAAHAFAESGYAATSMDDVASSAGITKLIVYRHFESKDVLYREILEDVANRLAAEWQRFSDGEHARGAAIEVLLTVAREQPEGFRLLFVHSAREADFVSYHAEFRLLQLDLADRVMSSLVPDPLLRRWASRQIVDFVVTAVLNWIDIAPPADDAAFAQMATRSMVAMAGKITLDRR